MLCSFLCRIFKKENDDTILFSPYSTPGGKGRPLPHPVPHLTPPIYFTHFSATVCKTVHLTLSVRCLSCLSITFGVLWPNGRMDQDETWYGGRPRPWPHCVRWGPRSPPETGTAPIFGPCLFRFRFRFIRIVARRLKITKFTANRKKH